LKLETLILTPVLQVNGDQQTLPMVETFCPKMVGVSEAARLAMIKLGAFPYPLSKAYGPSAWEQQHEGLRRRKAPLWRELTRTLSWTPTRYL
jgi:hypothetical protein